MRLLIRQRVFSWADSYDVYDEEGTPKYFVKAELWRLGHVIHVYDRDRRELGMIQQRLLTFMPKFELYVQGQYMGLIKKDFTFFKPKYSLEYNNWQVEGDYMAWCYSVTSDGMPVMTIDKELFHWSDTYVIDIPDDRNEIMGLLIVIAIDAANCSANAT